MKLKLAGVTLDDDAFSAPRADVLDEQRYSEWHHFTWHDGATGIAGMVNLAVSGDVRRADRGRIGVSLLACDPSTGWHGGMNLYGLDEAAFSPGSLDVRIAQNAVRRSGDGYAVTVATKDGAVRLDATWTPSTAPIRIDNMGGIINAFVVPRLAVSGTVTIGGRAIALRGAHGYHDHNWGAWEWGRELGWDWGYLAEPPGGAEPYAFVFGQVTDGTRAAAKTELVLLVWRGAALSHVFLDESLDLAASGRLRGTSIPRYPGLMTIFEPGEASVPSEVELRASEGADRLAIRLHVREAAQFLIPRLSGTGHTTIAELTGEYEVDGVLDGARVAFRTGGFAEVAGAGAGAHLPRLRVGV